LSVGDFLPSRGVEGIESHLGRKVTKEFLAIVRVVPMPFRIIAALSLSPHAKGYVMELVFSYFSFFIVLFFFWIFRFFRPVKWLSSSCCWEERMKESAVQLRG